MLEETYLGGKTGRKGVRGKRKRRESGQHQKTNRGKPTGGQLHQKGGFIKGEKKVNGHPDGRGAPEKCLGRNKKKKKKHSPAAGRSGPTKYQEGELGGERTVKKQNKV